MKADTNAVTNLAIDITRYIDDMQAMRGLDNASVFTSVGMAFSVLLHKSVREDAVDTAIALFAKEVRQTVDALNAGIQKAGLP